MSMADDDILWDRLRAIGHALPGWLTINREALMGQVIATALNSFRTQPSPEHIEGIETGLDFLGLLLNEGSDNGLYEATMEMLDGEIYSAVKNLSEDEQIVLLLPFCGDIDDLVRDREIDEWAKCLFSNCDFEWQEKMRQAALNEVVPRSRYED